MEQRMFLNRREAAFMLNISVDTLDTLANLGHINRTKIGARTVYDPKNIRDFAERAKKKGVVSLAK